MSEPMPSIPTQSPFTYPNPNPSASPSFTQDDTSDSFIPEPTQPIPTYTQPAFSQPAFSQPNQSFFSQPAVHLTQPSQTNPNNVQSQQFQQFQTATISANNAKFPYLEKEKYEIWAMKMEYWIQNADHNLWRIVQQGNSPKRLGKDAKGNTIVHPPVSLDEHVAVQRENKVRTLLLQALPEDHMPDFHHYDDARDIWLAVKARFGGNEESKKMRKTMLKQQFTEFSVTEEEGLHKGYDRFQKILSQLNQVQARPDNDDINLKFLRALPSSWSQVGLALKTRGGLDSMSFDDLYNKLRSLELDVRIGHSYSVKAAVAPTHSAFGAASSGSKPTYSDQQRIVPSVSQTSGRSDNIMECVDQLEMEELDLKWQMAMLSLRINRFEKKAGRKMNTHSANLARFEEKVWVRCYKCLQLGHFARECNVKTVDDKARYSAFKVTEVKTDEPKALVSVDSMVNWSDHAAENKTGEVEKVYGMMAGLHADNGGAGVSNAADEFAMMGISPKPIQVPVPRGTHDSYGYKVCSRISQHLLLSDGSDPAASRNRPAVNSAGRPKPTERVGHPAGWSKRPAPVSAGRPVSAGWLNPAARPYFRPSSVHFNNMYWPNLYDPMYMNKGRRGTAVKTSAGYSWKNKRPQFWGSKSNGRISFNPLGDPSTDNDISRDDIVILEVEMARISEKGTIRHQSLTLKIVLKIHTDDNVADLLTKAFDGPRFEYLVVHIRMVDMVLVSAGSTMILLGVILPAGCLVSAGSYGLCCWFRVHAGRHTSPGGFISADRVCVPAVCMVSRCWLPLFSAVNIISAAGIVYADYTSIYAAELVCVGSIILIIAGWLSHANRSLRFAGCLQSCWVVTCYALTHAPPVVFDSLVKQFWATAVVRPNAAGSHDLVATIDGREGQKYSDSTMLPLLLLAMMLMRKMLLPMKLLVVQQRHTLNLTSSVSRFREPPPERQPPASPPSPPAQTFMFEEPLVFGPAPRPAGDVDPDPDNYLEPEDLDNLLSMEDDTTHGGFHVESPVRPDDASTPTADAAGRAEDPVLLTSLSAKLDRFKQLRTTRLVGDVPAAEGDVDIQDDVDLDGLSRMASAALGHNQPAVPSEDVEEREEEEVPLRRKRSAYRRARTEFSTPAFEQFQANLSADGLPHTAVSESACPSVAADKRKAPLSELDIPTEFLAEDALARKRFDEEQASERLVQQLRAEDLAQKYMPNVSEERAKELDDLMMRMTETDWLHLMMQVGSNPALAKELLGADVNEGNFIKRMTAVKERKKRALADLRYRALKGKPLKKLSRAAQDQSGDN
ncbi:ribonuclease H-like domain-containing protein [Tanacetum coccineum]